MNGLGSMVGGALWLVWIGLLGCAAVPDPLGADRPEPAMNADGVAVFYAAVERLQHDEDPDDEFWAELFTAPGYAQLDAVEQRSDSISELIELAYRPSMKSELEERLARGDSNARGVIPNLLLAVEQRSAVEAMIAELERPAVMAEVLENVAAWLPDGAMERVSPPPLYLVVLDGDSKAFPDSLVLDVVGLAMTGPDYAKRLLGHEFHHYFRGPLDRVTLDDVPQTVRPVVRLMERAETEGIADLIDKRDLVFGEGGLPEQQLAHPLFAWMWEIYLPALAAAPEHVAELGRLLEQIDNGELDLDRAKTLERAASRLSARPIGIYVADAVERRLGRARLIRCVGDPFELMLAYAEAARSDATLPTLSPQACKALVSLREEFGRAN